MRTLKLIVISLVLMVLPPLGTIAGFALLITMATGHRREAEEWILGDK